MKQKKRLHLLLTTLAISLVLVIGSSVANNALANGPTYNCNTRWGEPIGIGCRTLETEKLAKEVYSVDIKSEARELSGNCRTRWGEPIGAGCRITASSATVSGKVYSRTETQEYSGDCRTRWGEPIGVGCRVPSGN